MNPKFNEQPQYETFSLPKQELAKTEDFFSHLLDAIKFNESKTNQLPIVLSDLKPSVSFEELQFKLHGIVYNGKKESYALISKDGGVQEVYQIDSLLFKNTIVKGISKSEVEIHYYNESHILQMELQGNGILTKYVNLTEQNFSRQQTILEQDKRRNPIRLLMIRRPYAVYENHEFVGYKIMPGSNADQFIRLGFERGDIITSLNGLTLDGPGMQPFIIKELTHSRNIDLVVLRGEDTLSILYGF